ncbi:hypothetical protein ACN28S_50255 [Cystobacter fuscus]
MALAVAVALVSPWAPASLAAPRPRAPQQTLSAPEEGRGRPTGSRKARDKRPSKALAAPEPSASEPPPSTLAPDAPTVPRPEETPPPPPPSAPPSAPGPRACRSRISSGRSSCSRRAMPCSRTPSS